MKHGITQTTYERITLGPGAIYLNYGEPDEQLLGATRGGSVFELEQEIREIEVDGARGPVRGGRRVVRAVATLTVNLIEISTEALLRAIPGATSSDYPDSGSKTHDEIVRSRDIQDTDYLTNVAILASVLGKNEDLIIELRNVLADGNLSITFEDQDEGVIELRFVAHYDGANMDKEPWVIRNPDA